MSLRGSETTEAIPLQLGLTLTGSPRPPNWRARDDKYHNKKQAQSLVELLVVIALCSLLIPAIISGLISSREGKAQQYQRSKATALLQEGQEAVRSIREKGWTNITTNGTYYPRANASNAWELVLSETGETLAGFTRQIVIADVLRDGNGAIVQTGGSIDPSTKKITTSVNWDQPQSSSVQSIVYLARYLDNLSNTETTQTQFNAGTKTGTTVVATAGLLPDDGQVVLGAGGAGNWCSPSLTITALDLPKSGVANAITAIEGRAFAGTGDNAAGVAFANINITNTQPPVASILATFDGYKTNAVFGETNYAYLATDNHSKEIVIIDLNQFSNPPTNTKYKEIGYFDASGNGTGVSVFVLGNVGYMISSSGNKFYTFDLSSKSGERFSLGSYDLQASGKNVVVVGTYAYVTVSDLQNALMVFDVGDPGNIKLVGTASIDLVQTSRGLYVNPTGTRGYLALGNLRTVAGEQVWQGGFYIIDTTDKSYVPGSPHAYPTQGKYNTQGMDPRGVAVVPGNKAIIVGQNAEEYQVVDIGTESNPVNCGGLNIDSGINGVVGVLEADGDAYSYIITGDTSSELKIIEGGPGGQYASSGTFESQFYLAPVGSATAFNRFDVDFDKPSQTNLEFQVAVADAISGSCNGVSYTFLGPDGTVNTRFSISSPIPLVNIFNYKNPGSCFKYKVYLTTNDSTMTPVLYDFTVNHSP